MNYGRGVGYEVNQINVGDAVASISATEIRRQIVAGEDGWKTLVDARIHEMLAVFLRSK